MRANSNAHARTCTHGQIVSQTEAHTNARTHAHTYQNTHACPRACPHAHTHPHMLASTNTLMHAYDSAPTHTGILPSPRKVARAASRRPKAVWTNIWTHMNSVFQLHRATCGGLSETSESLVLWWSLGGGATGYRPLAQATLGR